MQCIDPIWWQNGIVASATLPAIPQTSISEETSIVRWNYIPVYAYVCVCVCVHALYMHMHIQGQHRHQWEVKQT